MLTINLYFILGREMVKLFIKIKQARFCSPLYLASGTVCLAPIVKQIAGLRLPLLWITNQQSIAFTFNQELRDRNLCRATIVTRKPLLFSSVHNSFLLADLAACVVVSHARWEHKNVRMMFSRSEYLEWNVPSASRDDAAATHPARVYPQSIIKRFC